MEYLYQVRGRARARDRIHARAITRYACWGVSGARDGCGATSAPQEALEGAGGRGLPPGGICDREPRRGVQSAQRACTGGFAPSPPVVYFRDRLFVQLGSRAGE